MDVHLANLLQANQYAFHAIVVGLVIVSALLVFVFGFKTSVEPPFDKITSPHDDRKTNGKKRKGKEKVCSLEIFLGSKLTTILTLIQTYIPE